MVLWSGVFGALFGWMAVDFETYGVIVGGFLGAMLGLWLQSIVRGEIARGVARGIDQFRTSEARRLEREQELGDARTAPPPPASISERVPATRSKTAEAPIPEPARPARVQAQAATAAPVVREQRPPREHNLIEKGLDAAKGWLLGGNTIVRVGLVLLFIGLSFLASFAANAGLFPIEIRLALVGAFGIGLLVIGLRKRIERPAFGLALQGTGVGVLYLTIFAAGRLYTLLPPVAAFALMIIVCALGCGLALRQNSQLMAFAAFAGGFAVPILLGGESRTPLAPFTYYTILNVAILFIAWKRSWRPLNMLGFFATFLFAAAWGATRYAPEHYLICQVFLAISVGIYLATAILYAHNTPGKLGNAADQTLLFGPAIAGFGLQAALVEPFPYGAAFSALGFAAVYTALAVWTFRRRDSGMAVLNDCLIAIGVGFVTLAVPLALDVKWTSAAWALEGAGAFWIGMRQQRWLARMFGLALQGVAALVFMGNLGPNIAALPIINGGFIGAMLIAAPLMLTGWWLREALGVGASDSKIGAAYAAAEHGVRHLVYLAGFAFVCLAIGLEVSRMPTADAMPLFTPIGITGVFFLGVLGAMWTSAWFGRSRSWPVAIWPSWLSLVAPVILLLVIVADGSHVLYTPNWALLLGAFALHLDLLRRNDADRPDAPSHLFHAIHAAGVWLFTAILADCLSFAIDQAALWETSWAGVIFLVSVTLMLLGLTLWAAKPASRWPRVPHANAYIGTAAIPLAVLTYMGALTTALIAEGVTDPLPYIPLLNPVDLSLGLALVTLALWRRALKGMATPPTGTAFVTSDAALVAGALLAFVIINTIWLRTAHHWLGVDWTPDALGASATVQTGLSILWTLIAMALMLFAHRRAERLLWLVGAGLIGVVVVKLLLVDMSSSETWVKAVAFVGVGVIMLAIGYFVPIPPAEKGAEPKAKEEKA